MKFPDLKTAHEPVNIQGTLTDYIISLAPFHHHSTTVGVFDEQANVCFQNEACRYFLEDGRSSADTLYTDEHLHKSAQFEQPLDVCLSSGQVQAVNLSVFFDRKISVKLNLIFRPIIDDEKKIVGCLFTLGEESISYNKHHLSNLQETINTYREQIGKVTSEKIEADYFVRALLKSTPFPVMLLNNKRQVMQINQACENLLGLSSRQAMAESCEQFFDCYQKNNGCPVLDKHLNIDLEEGQCLLPHESETHILRSAVLLTEKNEHIILEAFIDISDRHKAEQELKQLHKHNRLLLESTSDGIFGIDTELNFTFANNAAANILGYLPGELLGHDVYELIHHSNEDGETLAREELAIYQTIQHGKKYNADTVFWLQDGNAIPVQYSSSPVYEDGQLTGAVIVFRNVAEERALSKKMEYMATHDGLTGLVNRNEFERQIKDQISACKEQHQAAALCYIDLDQFKLVNDTCGHAAGDALLRQLTNVLHNNMRSDDTLARLGGDEFGILYRDCDVDSAMALTKEACKIIEEFRFIWEGKSFSVKASAGLAVMDEHIEDDAKLMSAADSACYIAKERGRNTIHIYKPDDKAIEKRHSEMIWVTRINEALLRNQFQLYFQPIVHRGDTECCHFIEILVRLHQPEYSKDDNVTLPGAFIPAAERYDLMPNIDHWVTKNVIRWLVKGASKRPELKLCSINLSGHTIGNTQFAEFIEEQLRAHPHIASMLCFEITETAAVADLKRAIEFINFLKGFGCQFALDDFGSGMSSFSYLKNLPVDFLKIDGTFVRDMAVDRIDFAMVEAINQVGQVMGIKTIAEYVENEAIVKRLDMLGVDYMQGHCLAKPQPIENFPASLRQLSKIVNS